MKVVRLAPYGATHAVARIEGPTLWYLSAITACGQHFPRQWAERKAVTFGVSRGTVEMPVGCGLCKRTRWYKEQQLC